MSNSLSASAIAARLKGLRDAMDTVIAGSTPDHGKWVGINSFIRNYNSLALAYANLTGDNAIDVYKEDGLKSPYSMTWLQQKELFDSIYLNTLVLINLVDQSSTVPDGPMYNLLVSGREESWRGDAVMIDRERCVREYTDDDIARRYSSLDTRAVNELKRLPSIFSYEKGCDIDPKFGYITNIIARLNEVKIEYVIIDMKPFLKFNELNELSFELDIGKLEMYRTHWAVKKVNLVKELHAKGISIQDRFIDVKNSVNLSDHIFDAALSFPGESRIFVENVAKELERIVGPNKYFYDNNYRSQLAQPSLDVLLQGIYSRAKLDVVFLSEDYQRKDWCGVEFRVIREIIMNRENGRVMFIRLDDGHVDGVFKTDGYIDARQFDAASIAEFIKQRVDLL